jgi:hypothetical protein
MASADQEPEPRGSTSLVVSVVDATSGAPIAGAQVSVGDLTAITSGQGEATLRPVHPGWVDLVVSAPGYARLLKSAIATAAPRNRVEVRMSAGFSVAGRVVDEGGTPVPGTSVFVLDDVSMPVDGGSPAAVTDDDGRFHVTEVAAGVRRIFAIDIRHAPTRSGPLVIDGDQLDVVVTMRKGCELHGRVVDAAGAPVGNTVVRVESHDHLYARQMVSDAAGRFTLLGLGRTYFYASARAGFGASELDVVDLTGAALLSIDLRILATGTIAGVVIDVDGRPCPHAPVNAVFRANSSVISSVVADEVGHFSIDDLPAGDHVVWAGPFGESEARYEPVARTGDTNVRLTMPTFGSVRGEVVCDGDALVRLMGTSVGVEQSYQLECAGPFELHDLPPDTYQMWISGRDFVDARSDVAVVANQVTDLGTIQTHRGREIAGEVVDENGTAVSGARLRVGLFRKHGVSLTRVGDRFEVTSGVGGRFTIAGLEDTCRYYVIASHALGDSLATEVPATVVVLPCGALLGTVVDGGRPVPDVHVVVGDPETQATLTDDNGAFAFARVPKGQVPIRVTRNVLDTLYAGVITVEPGQRTVVAIDIAASGRGES